MKTRNKKLSFFEILANNIISHCISKDLKYKRYNTTKKEVNIIINTAKNFNVHIQLEQDIDFVIASFIVEDKHLKYYFEEYIYDISDTQTALRALRKCIKSAQKLNKKFETNIVKYKGILDEISKSNVSINVPESSIFNLELGYFYNYFDNKYSKSIDALIRKTAKCKKNE